MNGTSSEYLVKELFSIGLVRACEYLGSITRTLAIWERMYDGEEICLVCQPAN